MSSEFFLVRRGAVALRNHVVLGALSMQALAVLTVALAMRPGTPMGYKAFAKRGLGETAARNALRELEDAGFRWRFLVHRDGKLRTVTIISDEPLNEAEARQVAAEREFPDVGACSSMADRMRRSGRVVDSTTHTDQRKQEPSAEPVDNSVRGGESTTHADLHKQGISAGHSGWVSSGSHSDTPQIGKPISKEAKASLPAQPGTRSADGPPADPGRPWAGPGGAADLVGAKALVSECLPIKMRYLDPGGMVEIARMLQERLDAGWKPSEIQKTLERSSLPAHVKRMAGVVKHRLREDIVPELAPCSMDIPRKRLSRPEVRERVMDPPEVAWDGLWSVTLERVKNENPGLGWAKWMALATAELPARTDFLQRWKSINAAAVPAVGSGEVTARVLTELADRVGVLA